MKLSELVSTTEEVAATSSRLAKIDALARLLVATVPDEITPLVGLLLAAPRQGRLGVGWRRIASLDVAHAAGTSLKSCRIDKRSARTFRPDSDRAR